MILYLQCKSDVRETNRDDREKEVLKQQSKTQPEQSRQTVQFQDKVARTLVENQDSLTTPKNDSSYKKIKR